VIASSLASSVATGSVDVLLRTPSPLDGLAVMGMDDDDDNFASVAVPPASAPPAAFAPPAAVATAAPPTPATAAPAAPKDKPAEADSILDNLPSKEAHLINSIASHMEGLFSAQHPFLPPVDAEPTNPRRAFFTCIIDYLSLKNPTAHGVCPECAKKPDSASKTDKNQPLNHFSQHMWRCQGQRPESWQCAVCTAVIPCLEQASDDVLAKYDKDEQESIQRTADDHRVVCIARMLRIYKSAPPSTDDDQIRDNDDDEPVGEVEEDELEDMK
jgi:hypothetical protein